jgi:hypothetical protein
VKEEDIKKEKDLYDPALASLMISSNPSKNVNNRKSKRESDNNVNESLVEVSED